MCCAWLRRVALCGVVVLSVAGRCRESRRVASRRVVWLCIALCRVASRRVEERRFVSRRCVALCSMASLHIALCRAVSCCIASLCRAVSLCIASLRSVALHRVVLLSVA